MLDSLNARTPQLYTYETNFMASNGSKVKPPAVPLFFLRVGAAVSMPVLVACERFHAFLQCMLSSGILLKGICVICRLSAQRSCKCCSGTTTMTCSLCWLVCASCACVPARKQTSDHVPPAFAQSSVRLVHAR